MTIKQLFQTAPITTLLLISFVGLYIIQVLSGVDANNPSTQALLTWGANALPFTMRDEPWRLISSGFLHIGLMHLLFNGFAMYFFGQVAEPMFGSSKFFLLFLLAVIGGNLLNNYVTWQGILDETTQPGISAGASGGIMGIGAALLVAALFKITINGLMLKSKSLIFIMGINLLYGFAIPGIDNAGHIGGALTGLLIALPIGLAHRQRMLARQSSVSTYQTDYVNYQPVTIIKNDVNNDIYANNNSNIPVNSSINTDTNPQFNNTITSITSTTPTTVKSALIWQLLPSIVMLLIAAGFVWWWLDIHNQILQILASIE